MTVLTYTLSLSPTHRSCANKCVVARAVLGLPRTCWRVAFVSRFPRFLVVFALSPIVSSTPRTPSFLLDKCNPKDVSLDSNVAPLGLQYRARDWVRTLTHLMPRTPTFSSYQRLPTSQRSLWPRPRDVPGVWPHQASDRLVLTLPSIVMVVDGRPEAPWGPPTARVKSR